MKFSCDQCHAQYMIADEKVGTKGVKVKCKKCSHIIVVRPAAAEPAPAPAESAPQSAPSGQMGGAFDSLFGAAPGESPAAQSSAPSEPAASDAATSGGDFGFDAFGQTQPSTTAAPSRPAGEKEWYVAIDDSQVGPIDIAEIEQRWDARELDEDSLAWKAGMSDWMPIAEIPELAYLVTERPHAKPQAAAQAHGLGAGASAPAGAAASGLGAAALGPVTLGGGASEEGVSWTPSAASALSSLVQEELVAATAPKPEPQPEPQRPAGVPDLGMPTFGAGDLFGAAGGNGSSAVHQPDPFAAPAPAPAWSVPTTPRRESSGKWIYAVVGVLAVGVLGVVGILAMQMMKSSGGAATTAAAQPSGGKDDAAATDGSKANTEAKNETANRAEDKQAVADKPAEQPKKADEPDERARRTSARAPSPPPKRDPPPSRTTSSRNEKKDDLDALLEGGGKKPSGPVKAQLTKEDIFNGVKTNARSVQGCIVDARRKNEIVPGKYTFVLDWTINPDGSVSNARLKGPSNVMGTSLPRCFAAKMRSWSFPASRKATPIANFPFGPITIR